MYCASTLLRSVGEDVALQGKHRPPTLRSRAKTIRRIHCDIPNMCVAHVLVTANASKTNLE